MHRISHSSAILFTKSGLIACGCRFWTLQNVNLSFRSVHTMWQAVILNQDKFYYIMLPEKITKQLTSGTLSFRNTKGRETVDSNFSSVTTDLEISISTLDNAEIIRDL